MKILKDLTEEKRSTIFFESPKRIIRTLVEMEEVFGKRKVSIVKEMTKIHEDALRGNISEIVKNLPKSPKGEFIIVLWGRE